MKLLLVDAIGDSELHTALPHLGLAYIAAYLRERMTIEIKIVSKEVVETVHEFKPDVVGISSVSENYNIAKKYVSVCKSLGITTIIGGHHITALPDTLCADLGVLGEGEQTAYEVIECIQKYGFALEKLKHIKGVAYFEDGKVKITERREPIEPMDKLPFPARDLLPIQKNGWVHLFTSRSCCYKCIFCASSAFWGKLRFFSAEYVMKELKFIIETYNPSFVTFSDDLFIADRQRFEKIVNMICEEGIHKKVKFILKCRANLLNDEVMKLLRKMSVIEIGAGIESGCQTTLSYLKDSVTVEQNAEAIRLTKKYKILFSPTFIIGAPYETKADALETLEFIKRTKPDQFNFFQLIPLPSTVIWEYALKRGLVSNDMEDWSKLNLDPNVDKRKRIFMAEKMTIEEFEEVHALFEKERKKRWRSYAIRKAIRHPKAALLWLKKKVQ